MAIAFDVRISAIGQELYGLWGDGVDGLGLETYGFIWSCGSIWDSFEDVTSTTWSDCPSPTPSVEECIHE